MMHVVSEAWHAQMEDRIQELLVEIASLQASRDEAHAYASTLEQVAAPSLRFTCSQYALHRLLICLKWRPVSGRWHSPCVA
jgi:hypothetical protein